jgi:hypothetical protein
MVLCTSVFGCGKNLVRIGDFTEGILNRITQLGFFVGAFLWGGGGGRMFRLLILHKG